jgi:hypothetical protein
MDLATSANVILLPRRGSVPETVPWCSLGHAGPMRRRAQRLGVGSGRNSLPELAPRPAPWRGCATRLPVSTLHPCSPYHCPHVASIGLEIRAGQGRGESGVASESSPGGDGGTAVGLDRREKVWWLSIRGWVAKINPRLPFRMVWSGSSDPNRTDGNRYRVNPM